MHENREISSAPWSQDQGRSAKAMNRTADTHVLEKSDCAVVPVNQPNKGGRPSAEAGEGRAQTKENIVQSRMPPAQNGKHMSQGLHGVRKAARERKQERFTSLLHHLNVGLLRDSFYALKRQASPGVDGVTWQEYETGLEDRLVDLHSCIEKPSWIRQNKVVSPWLPLRVTYRQLGTSFPTVLVESCYRFARVRKPSRKHWDNSTNSSIGFPASHLPELLNATFTILRSVAGLFKPMKAIHAQRNTTHNETATKGALRVISTIIPTKFRTPSRLVQFRLSIKHLWPSGFRGGKERP